MSDARVIEHLNGLLADAVIYYYKIHNYHWFVKGHRFKELHETFEGLYESAHQDLDDLAERVLTIGGKPLGTLAETLTHATIKEETQTRDAEEMIRLTLADLKTRVERIRAAADISDEQGDRGTTAMLEDLIQRIEKTSWMLESAFGTPS
ncbi:MAG: general stress protein 20U [Phycisphaeraceae bacterium]|nr:MAG: general stress protein 20U [Phycisphaeraceae bacterium]